MFNDVKGNDNSTIMIHVDFCSDALSHSAIRIRISLVHAHTPSPMHTQHTYMRTVPRAKQKRDEFFSPFNGSNAIHIAHEHRQQTIWFRRLMIMFVFSVVFGIGPVERVCMRVLWHNSGLHWIMRQRPQWLMKWRRRRSSNGQMWIEFGLGF